MLTIALCVLIAAGVTYYKMRATSERIIATVFAAVMSLFFGVMFCDMIGEILPTKFVPSHDLDLVAVRSDTGGESSYFLFGTRTTIGWEYRYYVSQGEFIRPGSVTVQSNEVLIRETDSESPKLQVSKAEFVEPWYEWFGILNRDYLYTFVVPKGSVVQEFKL